MAPAIASLQQIQATPAGAKSAGMLARSQDVFNSLNTKSNQMSFLVHSASPEFNLGRLVGRKHLRSANHLALRHVLKAARRPRRDPAYVSQRQLAAHLGIRQSGYGMMETGERRVGVLDFIDISDAHSSNRLALFRALLKQCPRRIKPIRRTPNWRAAAKIRAVKRRKATAPSGKAKQTKKAGRGSF